MEVAIGPDTRIPLASPVQVRVPNPVSFIAQKLLIQNDRLPEKRPQDMLYIHDTLELFGHQLQALRATWREQLRPALPRRTALRVEQRAVEQFGVLTLDIEQPPVSRPTGC